MSITYESISIPNPESSDEKLERLLNEIKELSLSKYKEDNVIQCYPNFINKTIGMHHMHQVKDFFIADLCFNSI